MGKRYDILRLLPQDEPVYLVVGTTGFRDRDNNEYYYETRTCSPDILSRVTEVIIGGDTDPHGIVEYVGSAEEPTDVQDWIKIIAAMPPRDTDG